MTNFTSLIGSFLHDEDGQDLIEYALLATFLALVTIAGATLLGASLNNWYSKTASGVDGHAASAS